MNEYERSPWWKDSPHVWKCACHPDHWWVQGGDGSWQRWSFQVGLSHYENREAAERVHGPLTKPVLM